MALDVDQIEKPARKVRKLLKKMPGDPRPADIHKFRTNSRRMRREFLRISSRRGGRSSKEPVKFSAPALSAAGRVAA